MISLKFLKSNLKKFSKEKILNLIEEAEKDLLVNLIKKSKDKQFKSHPTKEIRRLVAKLKGALYLKKK